MKDYSKTKIVKLNRGKTFTLKILGLTGETFFEPYMYKIEVEV